MATPLSLTCPRCSARLKLKDLSRLGTQVRCPKCATSFVAERPPAAQSDPDLLDDDVWLTPDDAVARRPVAGPRSPRRQGRPRATPAGARRSVRANKQGSPDWLKPALLWGGCCAVVLLAGVVGLLVLNRDGDRERAQRERIQKSIQQARQQYPSRTDGLAAQHAADSRFGHSPQAEVPITDDEARAFATRFAEAITKRDADAFDRLFDHMALLDRAMADIHAVPLLRQGFTSGYMQTASKHAFFNQLSTNLGQAGSFELVRIRDGGGERRALFRLFGPDTGVTYFEAVLGRKSGGEIRAVDIFAFSSGELFSETLRRGYLQAVASQGTPGQPTAQQRDLLAAAQVMPRIAALSQSGQAREALQLLDGLPLPVRHSKNVVLMRVNVARSAGTQEYYDAMQEFRQRFPNDAAIELMAIDFHLLNGEIDKSLEAVDRLDKAVGGDPSLSILRANLKVAQGDLEAARTLLNETIAQGAAVEHALWSLIDVALAEQKFDEVTELLNRIDREFGIRREFAAQAHFALFLASPQYRQWLASRDGSP